MHNNALLFVECKDNALQLIKKTKIKIIHIWLITIRFFGL